MSVYIPYEHITPLSAGGETLFTNLCLACPTCNRYKASRQFFGMKKLNKPSLFIIHISNIGMSTLGGV